VPSEAKPFASLSSGLLARKGAARPAMRPQGFGQIGGGNLEDLGWDDMGFEPPKPAAPAVRDEDHDAFGEEIGDQPKGHPTGLTPVHSPVHTQQDELAERLGAEAPDEEDAETIELLEVETSEPPVAPVAPVAFLPAQPRRLAPPRARAAPGGKAKAAFTLRLDPERHLRLRLACAVNGRSAQLLVTDALDRLLDAMPELGTMAEKAKRKG
jgi:hypothetical protein